MILITICLLVATCCMLSESQCFIDEQATTPMKAISILSNVESWRKCVSECRNNAACVTATYSDELRVCHLQAQPDHPNFPTCNFAPYRRFRKTTDNCFPDPTVLSWVTYKRTNVSKEHEVDPCFPDASFLHPELVDLTGLAPTCPLRKLDGSQGQPVTVRFLSCDGEYGSRGTESKTVYNNAWNTWNISMTTDYMTFNHCAITVLCAEIGDECTCPGTLKPNPSCGGTPPFPNVLGACPAGQQLTTQRTGWFSGNHNIPGGDAMVFCVGGQWMAGRISTGEVYVLDTASCCP